MKAVKAKISNAQKRLDDGHKSLDDAHEKAIMDLEIKRDTSKMDLEDELVNEILCKFL